MLTQERIREEFEYDPERGVLIRHGRVVGSKTGKGYLTCGVGGKNYYVHRMVWIWAYGEDPEIVSHLNGVKTDNRILNLNGMSRKDWILEQRQPTTGVHYTPSGKWSARIKIDREDIYLGVFRSYQQAIDARKSAERRFYGYSKEDSEGC